MDQTYMKQKPVLPLVVSMALPMTLSMFVNSLYNIVDSIFIAKISDNAMTALSLVYPIQNLIMAITVGFAIGTNAVISIHLGAGNKKEADRAASLGTLLNAFHGLLLMIVCLTFIRPFLELFTTDQDVISLGIRYARITLSFSIPIGISVSLEKIFQATGRMKVSMVAMMAGCIGNIILDPLMIFGIGPFPAMGIEGAAIATAIGQMLSLVIYLIFCVVRPLPVTFSLSCCKPSKQLLLRLYTVGIPATLNLALPSLLVSTLNGILAAYSQSYVLVLGAYYKLQTFLYLTGNGVVQGKIQQAGIGGFTLGFGKGEMGRLCSDAARAEDDAGGQETLETRLCLRQHIGIAIAGADIAAHHGQDNSGKRAADFTERAGGHILFCGRGKRFGESELRGFKPGFADGQSQRAGFHTAKIMAAHADDHRKKTSCSIHMTPVYARLRKKERA